jgi:hypothetical protein
MTTVAAPPLLSSLVAFLESDGWPTAVSDDGVDTRFAGTSHEWACAGRAFVEQGQLVFDSFLPMSVPPTRRPAVATLLLQVNWTMVTGAFALDPDTGMVRFRTALFLPDHASCPPVVLKGLVYANVLTVDRCLPVLLAVSDGSVSLAEALESVGY